MLSQGKPCVFPKLCKKIYVKNNVISQRKYIRYNCEHPVFFHKKQKRIHIDNTEITPTLHTLCIHIFSSFFLSKLVSIVDRIMYFFMSSNTHNKASSVERHLLANLKVRGSILSLAGHCFRGHAQIYTSFHREKTRENTSSKHERYTRKGHRISSLTRV